MNTIIQLNDQLMQAPVGILVALLSIALGYILKSAAFFPNNRIPLVIIAISMAAFPLLQACAYAEKGSQHILLHVPQNIVIGIIIGFASWTFHAQILKKWVDPHFFDDENPTEPPVNHNDKTKP